MKNSKTIIKSLCITLLVLPLICNAEVNANQSSLNYKTETLEQLSGNKVGIVNGFDDLTKLSVNARPLVRATVQIIDEVMKAECTGVLISQNTILTSAHCVLAASVPIYKTGSSINVTYMHNSTNNTLMTATYRTTVTKTDIDEEYISHYCRTMVDSEDILKKCSRYDQAILTLSTNIPTMAKPLEHDVLTNLKDTDFIDTNGNIKAGNKIIYAGAAIGDYVEYGMITSNINTLKYSQIYETLDSSDIIAQPGDSGGPLFVCNNTYTKCKLIGLISGGDGARTVFTPLY